MAQKASTSSGEAGSLREISLDELKRHDKKTDAWIAIRGKIYDVTDFISRHPGGVNTISKGIGKDGTALFENAHSYVNPEKIVPGKQVGVLVGYKTK